MRATKHLYNTFILLLCDNMNGKSAGREVQAVPSILTPSAKVIMRHYKRKIVEIHAKSGFYGANKTILNKDYGITINSPGATEMEINYVQRRTKQGKIINPLIGDMVKEICNDIDKHLNPYEDEETGEKYSPDLAVSSFTIELRDNDLQNRSNSNTNVFDMYFVSDALESEELRDTCKKMNAHMGLFNFQGFKIRSLNMHELIETQEKYSQEKKKYIQQWYGIEDVRPMSPLKIAQYISLNHLPKKYGDLNILTIKDNRKVVLEPYGGIK